MPVPSLFAVMDPLWFIEIPMCMCGGGVGGPIALLILLAIRRPIARRVGTRIRAGALGAAVGAALGIFTFNVTFVIMLATSAHGIRAPFAAAGEVQRAVRDRFIVFTVGGAFLGIIPGMIAITSAYRDPEQGRSAPPAP